MSSPPPIGEKDELPGGESVESSPTRSPSSPVPSGEEGSPRPKSATPEPPRDKARGSEPKRPRYLFVAMIAALVFGAGCWTEGCGRLTFYRGDHDNILSLNSSIHDEGDRAHVESLYARFLDEANAARGRALPFAAATFVLGAALLALASRGMSGRSNTRVALMQVVAAQAIVVLASYWATSAMRNAELDWEFERTLVDRREATPPDEYREFVPVARAMRKWSPPGWLGIRSLASVLIIVALSRPRSRAFFDAASARAVDV